MSSWPQDQSSNYTWGQEIRNFLAPIFDLNTGNIKIGAPTDFTVGSLLFAGSSGLLSHDNANLFWDNTNKRLGIGTPTPEGQLSLGTGIYQNVFTSSQAEGIGGADLRIGLDESNRSLIILDRADIGTDLGLTAQLNPTIYLFSAITGQGYIKFTTSNGNLAVIDGSALGGIDLLFHSAYDFTVKAGGSSLFVFKGTGFSGFGVTVPTAVLHLKAGTAAANTAPLKLTSGINLTTPEAGAFEYDGTNLYFTPGSGVRKTITWS